MSREVTCVGGCASPEQWVITITGDDGTRYPVTTEKIKSTEGSFTQRHNTHRALTQTQTLSETCVSITNKHLRRTPQLDPARPRASQARGVEATERTCSAPGRPQAYTVPWECRRQGSISRRSTATRDYGASSIRALIGPISARW